MQQKKLKQLDEKGDEKGDEFACPSFFFWISEAYMQASIIAVFYKRCFFMIAIIL